MVKFSIMNKLLLLLIIVAILVSCKNTEKSKKVEETNKENAVNIDSVYLSKGAFYAKNTQKVLGKNLLKAMKKGGPEYALAFCNTKAMPLTDSMSVHQQVKISRISDKPRNSNNKATAEQEKYINAFKKQLANNEKVKPILEKKDGKIHFYAAIITNSICLKCHGDVAKDLDEKVVKSLASLYPKDQAVGYTSNQIRGAWHIVMDKVE